MRARVLALPLWHVLCVLLLQLGAAQRPTGGAAPIVFLRAGPLRLPSALSWDRSGGRRLLGASQPMADPRWGFLRRSRQFIVSLAAPWNATTLRDIDDLATEHGGRVCAYLPEDSLLLVGGEPLLERVADRHVVVGLGDFQPEHKLSPDWEPLLGGAGGNLTHFSGAFETRRRPDGAVLVTVDVSFPEAVFGARGNGSAAAYRPAEAAADEWGAALGAVCGDRGNLEVLAEGPTQAVVRVPAEQLPAALHWLSQQAAVHWLAPRPVVRAANYQGITILQTGRASPTGATSFQGIRPLWDAGLDGAGQVVGCGDSGVDVRSCYFYDPAVAVQPRPDLDAGGKAYFLDGSHRKVKYLRFFGDEVDGNGHGTHVAASIVGSTDQGAWRQHNGMAPGAKLAFTDLGVSTAARGAGIGVPSNLYRDYFPYPWGAGARIFSESWGSDSASYDALSRGVDTMSWENSEFLAVIAAGNFGGLATDANINSPGTCKNSLTVGATLTAESPNVGQVPVVRDGDVFRVIVQGGVAGDGAHNDMYNVQLAYFGPTFGSALLGTKLGLSTTVPVDGCSPITNMDAVRGKVALIERGNCQFVQKVFNAQQAGAVAVLVANNGPSGSFKMTYSGEGSSVSNIMIPAASMPRNGARPMYRALEAGRTLDLWIQHQQLPRDRFSNLAPFSSIGPTPDGRIKPDLVAPGLTVSAGAGAEPGQCRSSVLHGTSMATPLVGGAALLVRQYFMEGIYPSGVRVNEHKYTPSGALVKAVLIAGATGMSGTTPSDDPDLNGVPLESPPSVRQGFGRVNVGVSLPLKDARWSLQVVDQVPIETGESHKFCVTATGGWLKVVLVWHDPPSDVAVEKNLVNNLDMMVRSSGLGGATILGNGDRDDTNNVEMIHLSDVPYGSVVVTVSGADVPQGPQPYSLVVLGQFTGSLRGEYNPVKDADALEVCALVEAKVFVTPPAVSNNRHPVISFGAALVNSVVSAFECRLSGASPAPQLHNWRQCESPVTYRDLPDGTYSFDVRGDEESQQDGASFTVDTVPPVAQFASPPPPLSLESSMYLEVVASDEASPVSVDCKLERVGSDDRTAPPQLSGMSSLGRWERCDSPLQLGGLSEGVWQLSARATDAAGNSDAHAVATGTWRYDPDPSKVYSVILESPGAAHASSSARLEFGLARAYDQDVQRAGFECQLQMFSARLGYYEWASWDACRSPLTLDGLRDGAYRFRVRSASAGGRDTPAAAAELDFAVRDAPSDALRLPGWGQPGAVGRHPLQVDTQAPSILLSGTPQPLQTGPVATFVFSTDDPTAVTRCSLVGGGGVEFGADVCTSPKAYLNLGDGSYVFRVEAEDAAGNVAQAAEFAWDVDATPPALLSLQAFAAASSEELPQTPVHDGNGRVEAYKVSSAESEISLSWAIDDGPNGSGLASVFCTMTPIEVDDNPAAAVSGRGDLCASPQAYSLREGNYSFYLSAVDGAENAATMRPLHIFIDTRPPASVTRFGPGPDSPVPSTVLFKVEAIDAGVAPSGVAALWGLLQPLSAPEAASVADGDGGAGPPAPGFPPSGAGKDWGITLQADNTPVPLGEWVRLPYAGAMSSVVLQRVPSGHYSFQTLAVDEAGNIGREVAPQVFEVDESLPIPSSNDNLYTYGPADPVTEDAGVPKAVLLAVPIACGSLLAAFFAFGLWRYHKYKNDRRRARFHALRSDMPPDASKPRAVELGGRAGGGEDSNARLDAPLPEGAFEVGPWRLQLDWAPLAPMFSGADDADLANDVAGDANL